MAWSDRVFRHAYRTAQTRQDAEDVVASTFLELWRRRAHVRLVDRSVLPWLLVTATNFGRNTSRSTRRYRQLLERLPRSPDQPDAGEVALDAHALGVDARLTAGLRALNKISAAKARLHRARITLRERLGDQTPENRSDDQGGKR